MIFRAVFWVGLVALLMPHEPDLGFGRPSSADMGSSLPSAVTAFAKDAVAPSLKDPQSLCQYNASACAASASVLDTVKSTAMHSLSQVKADIAQNSRTHLFSKN